MAGDVHPVEVLKLDTEADEPTGLLAQALGRYPIEENPGPILPAVDHDGHEVVVLDRADYEALLASARRRPTPRTIEARPLKRPALRRDLFGAPSGLR